MGDNSRTVASFDSRRKTGPAWSVYSQGAGPTKHYQIFVNGHLVHSTSNGVDHAVVLGSLIVRLSEEMRESSEERFNEHLEAALLKALYVFRSPTERSESENQTDRSGEEGTDLQEEG